jgi:glutaminyl-peptide cyclotransferase
MPSRVAVLALSLALVACSRRSAEADTQAFQPQQSSPVAANGPALDEHSDFPKLHVDGLHALALTKQLVAFGARPVNSDAMHKQQQFIREQLKGVPIEEDDFTAETPAGKQPMKNLIAKFPGKTGGVVVLASHYDTLWDRKDFVGANDGASSSALLLEIAGQLRGKQLPGASVWLVWFDGEEAFKQWTDSDSTYGSRHLAEKWEKDGTLKRLRAFILLDMIGDADLNINRDTNSTAWLQQMALRAATDLGYQSYFYDLSGPISDDHLPFVRRGVPSLDLIDLDYGYNNAFWHTREDTPDKLSAKSFQIVGDVALETLRLLNPK